MIYLIEDAGYEHKTVCACVEGPDDADLVALRAEFDAAFDLRTCVYHQTSSERLKSLRHSETATPEQRAAVRREVRERLRHGQRTIAEFERRGWLRDPEWYRGGYYKRRLEIREYLFAFAKWLEAERGFRMLPFREHSTLNVEVD